MTGRILPPVPASASRDLTAIAPTARVTADVPQAPRDLRVNPPARALTGTVLGRDSAGNLLIRTHQGTLAVATRYHAPLGTRVTVRLIGSGASLQARLTGATTPPRSGIVPGPATGRGAAPRDLTVAGLTRVWPAVDAAVARFAEPPRANERRRSFPVARPGGRLAGQMFVLMSALAANDIREWLGAALDQLGRADQALAGQLEREFGQLAALARDPPGDWRLFAVPLALDRTVHQLRVFVHESTDQQPAAHAPRRFVVELELPHLGDLQVDGLAQPGRLDMILRTRQPLDADLTRELHALAAEARRTARVQGTFEVSAGDGWHMLPVPGQTDGAGFNV